MEELFVGRTLLPVGESDKQALTLVPEFAVLSSAKDNPREFQETVKYVIQEQLGLTLPGH